MNDFAQVPTYKSGHTLARLVITLLLANAIASLLAILSGFFEMSKLSRMVAGEVVPEEEMMWSDLLVGAVGLLQVAIFLSTVIFFLMWLYRAYGNLRALGASHLESSPGWAVGWFFIPILNLFKPYGIVKEIWRKSDPQIASSQEVTASPANPPLFFLAWWITWVISNILDNITFRLALRAETPEQMLQLAQVELFANVFNIPAAVLAALVVKNINRRQEERSKNLLAPHTPPPPPLFS